MLLSLSPKFTDEAGRLLEGKTIPGPLAPSPWVPNRALNWSYLVELSGSALSGQGLHGFKVIFIAAQLKVVFKHPTKKAEWQ